MSEHSPGPWESHGVRIYGDDGLIGEVGFGLRDDPEMIANARLIAAAPDLLALCKRWVTESEQGVISDKLVEASHAVIVRAEGATPC